MAIQRVGWRPYAPVIISADADAQAFIAAAGITDLTQASAINTLVVQLKAYGIWSKMKALYPMVGGTAAKHRFNLKDPRPVDAAFYLDFNGGWSHSSTGAKPDGINGYANTKMNLFTTVGGSSISHSTYVRLNTFKGCFGGVYSPVLMNSAWYDSLVVLQSISNTSVKTFMGNTGGEGLTGTVTALGGMVMGNRYSSTTVFTLKKDASTISTSASFSVRNFPTIPYYIGAYNENGAAKLFDSNEIAFYHIGDGMTDIEATNFYNAVQTFQTTLGRNIGTGITAVSDSSAVSFIATVGITDATQKIAINTLVTDLKATGVWTKMKAIYPFVGGSATTHKWNLKDPRDANDAYRLVFGGGMTHTSSGAIPNGSNAYADTFFAGSTFANNSQHVSFYSITNQASSLTVEVGAIEASTGIPGTSLALSSTAWNSGTPNYYITRLSGGGYASYGLTPLSNTKGFAMISRTNLNNVNAYWNGLSYGQTSQSYIKHTNNISLFARRYNVGGMEAYSSKTSAFASIGDGLTDAEALSLYTAVQKYQTILGRQVGTPVLPVGQSAGLLETYSGAAAAYSLRKLRAGYYGAAIRVRRSSDNAEQDIVFDAVGNLDTTSLLAFVGSGNGFVTTWYDQSGNGSNLIQTTAANQARIVYSGVLETLNGKPALVTNYNYSNSGYYKATYASTINGPATMFNIGSNVATVGASYLWDGLNNAMYAYSYNSTWMRIGGSTEFTLTGYSQGITTQRIINAIYNGASSKLRINDGTYSTGNTGTIASTGLTLGSAYTGSYLAPAYNQEHIVYPTNQESNATAINNNINSYYSIY